MAKKDNVKKNRKRRSFYEPQSTVFNEWLDAQSDLGMSIQLLISDAIKTYGDGDAIEAYFRTRIAGGLPEDAPAVQHAEIGAGALVEPVVKAPAPVRTEAPKAKPAPVVQVTPEPEVPVATIEDVVTPLPQAPKSAPVATAPEPEVSTDDAYDPLEIMMQDAQSIIRK